MTDLFEWLGAAKAYDAIVFRYPQYLNPNFLNPDWQMFGWVKDRLIEKKLFIRFCNYCWEKLYGVIPPAVWGGSLPEEYIDPSRFVQAVEEWRLSRLVGERRNP